MPYIPSDTAIAHATLTLAAQGTDPVMSFLASHYNQANVVTLAYRFLELSQKYHAHRVIPPHDDIIECIQQSPYSSNLLTHLKKKLEGWLNTLIPYAAINLSSLRIQLTHNYSYWIIDKNDNYWPQQLNDISLTTEALAPLCLWGLGNICALTSCSQPVSIVGSRAVDAYGRQVAYSAGKFCALHGHLVISGGALGADAAAHWGALGAADNYENAGYTVAVMAGGLDNIGPTRNTTLFQRITNNTGAIISELAPHTIPESYRFLQRNRLIAALGSVVLVAQAQHRSGALNTATWAANMNRLVLAAPGNINTIYNTGCNRLIYDGKATLLISATDMSDVCHEAHDPIKMSTDATAKALN